MSLFSVCLLGGSCQRPKRILKCNLVAGQSQKHPQVFSQSLYEKNSWIVFEVIWWLDCNMWKKGLWVYEICVLGLQSNLKYWSPSPLHALWRVEQYGQNVKGPLLVFYLYLCSYWRYTVVAQLTVLVLNWRGWRFFSSLKFWGEACERAMPMPLFVTFIFVIFGLHEKMDCHGQAFCWLDLRACCVLRLSANSSDPVPCVRMGHTETRGLAPFWVEHWSTQPAFIECLLYGGQWEHSKL